jgi:hypothetical protein
MLVMIQLVAIDRPLLQVACGFGAILVEFLPVLVELLEVFLHPAGVAGSRIVLDLLPLGVDVLAVLLHVLVVLVQGLTILGQVVVVLIDIVEIVADRMGPLFFHGLGGPPESNQCRDQKCHREALRHSLLLLKIWIVPSRWREAVGMEAKGGGDKIANNRPAGAKGKEEKFISTRKT